MRKVRNYHCNYLGVNRNVPNPRLIVRKIGNRKFLSHHSPYCGLCLLSWSEASSETKRS